MGNFGHPRLARDVQQLFVRGDESCFRPVTLSNILKRIHRAALRQQLVDNRYEASVVHTHGGAELCEQSAYQLAAIDIQSVGKNKHSHQLFSG